MTDKQTPPDWAFERVQDLRQKRGFTYLDAFAAYIAEHEQPPEDRKLLCAKEGLRQWGNTGSLAACVRSIELWEEGFGE